MEGRLSEGCGVHNEMKWLLTNLQIFLESPDIRLFHSGRAACQHP